MKVRTRRAKNTRLLDAALNVERLRSLPTENKCSCVVARNKVVSYVQLRKGEIEVLQRDHVAMK
jgi:hypothetical protein